MCKVALIGAGMMAGEHARAFADLPAADLVGVYSRTGAEALAQNYGIKGVYNSLAELYTATQADLVVVTVNVEHLTELALACLEYPWTILLEKPPGLTPTETALIQHKDPQCRVYVGLNRRAYSVTRIAQDLLDQQPSPRFIHVIDQQDMATARRLGHPEQVVTNFMYANSIHLIDYLRFFGRGEITQVEPLQRWQGAASQVVLAHIQFSSGDSGIYEGIWDGPAPWGVSIATPEQRLELRPLERLTQQKRGERQLQTFEPHPWDTQFKPGLRYQAEQALAAARGLPSSLPTLAEGLATMHLIERIFLA